jgi:hypothetical protein
MYCSRCFPFSLVHNEPNISMKPKGKLSKFTYLIIRACCCFLELLEVGIGIKSVSDMLNFLINRR